MKLQLATRIIEEITLHLNYI